MKQINFDTMKIKSVVYQIGSNGHVELEIGFRSMKSHEQSIVKKALKDVMALELLQIWNQ